MVNELAVIKNVSGLTFAQLEEALNDMGVNIKRSTINARSRSKSGRSTIDLKQEDIIRNAVATPDEQSELVQGLISSFKETHRYLSHLLGVSAMGTDAMGGVQVYDSVDFVNGDGVTDTIAEQHSTVTTTQTDDGVVATNEMVDPFEDMDFEDEFGTVDTSDEIFNEPIIDSGTIDLGEANDVSDIVEEVETEIDNPFGDDDNPFGDSPNNSFNPFDDTPTEPTKSTDTTIDDIFSSGGSTISNEPPTDIFGGEPVPSTENMGAPQGVNSFDQGANWDDDFDVSTAEI